MACVGARWWIAALWSLGACGDDPEVGGSAGGTEGSTGTPEASDGADTTEGEPIEPNVMPAGHLVEAPMEVLQGGSSVADYDGDGRPELVVAARYDSMSLGHRYRVYALLDDGSAIVQVDLGSYSDYDHPGSIHPMRMHDGPGIDGVRFETGSDAGLVPLGQGRNEEPLFRTMGDPVGPPSDADGDGWAEVAIPLADRIQLFESDGAGSFTVALELPRTCDDVAITHAPLDDDADDDLVVVETCPEGPVAHVFLDDAGPIGPAHTFDVTCDPVSLCLADLDGDPHPDLALLCEDQLEVHRGTADGSFTPLTSLAATVDLQVFSLCADFDGDGLRELLVPPVAFALPSSAPLTLLTLVDDELVTSDVDGLDFAFSAAGDLDDDGCTDLFGIANGTTAARISDCP